MTFVHNLFSVQFFYDRMPLYIIAMYPVFGYISYVLVQRTGIFKNYNVVVGALSVAFVFHCLFEVVDTVGPQWKWWAWNTQLSTSTPALGVVPYLNIQAFTIVLPFGLVLCTRLLCKVPHRGGWVIARDVVIVSLLVWPLQFLAALPATVVGLLGGSLDSARYISTWAYIALAAAVGGYAFIGAYRARRADPSLVPDGVQCEYFPLVYTAVYLICAAIFWIAGLPDYLVAHNGITPSGGQTGAHPYAVITFVLSVVLLAGAYAGTTERTVTAATAKDRSEVNA